MKVIMLVPVTVGSGAGTVVAKFMEGVGSKFQSQFASLAVSEINGLATKLLAGTDWVLDEVYEKCRAISAGGETVLLAGLSLKIPDAAELNYQLAVALAAQIVLVVDAKVAADCGASQLALIANRYKKAANNQILGLIANQISLAEIQATVKDSDPYGVGAPLWGALPFAAKIDKEVKSQAYEAFSFQFSDYFCKNANKILMAKSSALAEVTPTIFRANLMEHARSAKKRIILPEGEEPRILQAASRCEELGIARCVLLGSEQKIQEQCLKYQITLQHETEIIDSSKVKDRYVDSLYEIRKNKGMTKELALEQLSSNTMLATMMMFAGEVDGLVSGAVNTTADTIRPALQIIKTVPDAALVSSMFFMCFPKQVTIFGDCAINLDPSAEELAMIAIQCARSAITFGIEPRVAMLSYSTGSSARGAKVDKVIEATKLVKQRWPGLAVDGPLQYDAAVDPEVGKLKAPNSEVAGRATVLIMPDLDSGNIAYKVAQRSAGIVSMGPVLQGLRKPVNDLSRGCTVEDIIFTIALTAVQALAEEPNKNKNISA